MKLRKLWIPALLLLIIGGGAKICDTIFNVYGKGFYFDSYICNCIFNASFLLLLIIGYILSIADHKKKFESNVQKDFDELEWLRASASMPLASKVVEVGGRKLLDGGVADSIPLEYFESIGYERNVVILTQPEGFVKEHNRLMPLMRIALRKYPKMIEALDTRHIMYNLELEYVRKAEQAGRCLVIRPDGKIPIGHISHDPEEMRRVYDIGRKTGEKHIDQIKEFYICE